MSDRFDESLLVSPIPPKKAGRGRVVGWGVLLLVVAGFAAVLFAFSTDDDPPGETVTSGGAVEASTTISEPSASTMARVVLTRFESDPPLLYYPTLLPEGWETCRQLEDKSKGDRFCDPDDEPASWLQVAVKDADLVRLDQGRSSGDHGGVWLESGERSEIAYPVGQFLAVVISTETDLTEDDVLAISESIPLVGARATLYGSYELPLDLDAVTDEQLAELVEGIDPDPRIAGRRTGEAQIFTSTGSLYLFFGDGYTVPDFGPTVPYPYLAVADRPLVVGESPSRGIVYAVWDQRGYGWRLETQVTAGDIETIARDLIERIAELETE